MLFSYLSYQQMRQVFTGAALDPEAISADTVVYLLTGIANPVPIHAELRKRVKHVKHYEHPDHHQFSTKDIQQLLDDYKNDISERKLLITTEKDAQRLLDDALKALLLDLPVFYWPIEIALNTAAKDSFDSKILKYVSDTTRNR